MGVVVAVPNVPTNSAAITTMFPLRLVEASHWSRSLESDATVRADYALTTTTSSCCNVVNFQLLELLSHEITV